MQPRGSAHIRLAENGQPYGSGLSVHEEDNFGLLVSPPQVSLPIIVHPLRLYTELYDFSPFEMGSLRIQGNKILAVVVDIAQDPPCKPVWVRTALMHIFKYAAEVRSPALSLPLLGYCYGGLRIDTCLGLIRQALLDHKAILPPLITLQMDRQYMERAGRMLAAAGLMEKRVYTLRDQARR
jgi:hypothetical protein